MRIIGLVNFFNKVVSWTADIKESVDITKRITLRRTAKFLEKEAKLRAPVDTGALEDDITVRTVGKTGVRIINSIKSDKGFPYAAFLHETRDWKLGPKSRVKNVRGRARVGPKWMSRAYLENKNKIKDDIIRDFRVGFNT